MWEKREILLDVDGAASIMLVEEGTHMNICQHTWMCWKGKERHCKPIIPFTPHSVMGSGGMLL